MQALVTGAGGFLGRYVVEQLVARGDRVRAFSRQRYPELDALGVESIQGDIQDAAAVERACKGIEVVFHVAAVAGIWGAWRHYHGINTLGTAKVIAACRNCRVGRLVFTSSPSVTFAGRDQCGIDESAPYPAKWLAHYPHTKALAEQLVLAANTSELVTCSLRPHLIWGPRDQHLIPRLIERARSGHLRQVGDGANRIDAVYVENAAAAHLQAADAISPGSPAAGRAYFITNGEPVNCWQWINEILALAGLPPVERKISRPAAYAAGAALEALWTVLGRTDEPPMTRFLAAQLATSHYFDISAARLDLGYKPRISMAEGMRRLAEWLKPR
ncbi:MAG: NAD-dependent epimerase/dehydratase family protein [Planctomycetaceae bacterium]|nr:NAD-dependent epimerase/dehydratase family protein [Planctomycetaceae bacterium]